MLPEKLTVIEVVYEPYMWNNTRPMQSVHRHLGYMIYENEKEIHLTPELTFTSENRELRISHKESMKKNTVPRFDIFPLQESSDRKNIIQIDYEDPFHREGILSGTEAKSLKPSTFRMLGYLVHEDQKNICLTIATFEYVNGKIDYETVHIVPKSSILKSTYLEKIKS